MTFGKQFVYLDFISEMYILMHVVCLYSRCMKFNIVASKLKHADQTLSFNQFLKTIVSFVHNIITNRSYPLYFLQGRNNDILHNVYKWEEQRVLIGSYLQWSTHSTVRELSLTFLFQAHPWRKHFETGSVVLVNADNLWFYHL